MLISYDGAARREEGRFLLVNLTFSLTQINLGIPLMCLCWITAKDLLNADLVNAIESMDGVTGTKRWYYTDAEYRVNDYDDNWIYGFAKEDVSVLEENLIAGT